MRSFGGEEIPFLPRTQFRKASSLLSRKFESKWISVPGGRCSPSSDYPKIEDVKGEHTIERDNFFSFFFR